MFSLLHLCVFHAERSYGARIAASWRAERIHVAANPVTVQPEMMPQAPVGVQVLVDADLEPLRTRLTALERRPAPANPPAAPPQAPPQPAPVDVPPARVRRRELAAAQQPPPAIPADERRHEELKAAIRSMGEALGKKLDDFNGKLAAPSFVPSSFCYSLLSLSFSLSPLSLV